MKRILLYIIIMAITLAIPQRGMDVGKLLPVELVALDAKGGNITVATDTGNTGEGRTMYEAFRDLKQTTAGVIYLDTADYLLITEKAVEYLQEAGEYLKRDTMVCISETNAELAEAAAYLSVHQPDTTLSEILQGEKKIQKLTWDGNRLKLEK